MANFHGCLLFDGGKLCCDVCVCRFTMHVCVCVGCWGMMNFLKRLQVFGLGCRWCAGVIHVVGGWSVCAGAWNRKVVYEFVEGNFLPVSLVDETLHCISDNVGHHHKWKQDHLRHSRGQSGYSEVWYRREMVSGNWWGDGQLQFQQPAGIIAHKNSKILIVDRENHRI